MRIINADDCKHIGIGAGHVAISFEKDVIITVRYRNMRQFCENALFLMDEVMPDIDVALIECHSAGECHNVSDDEWCNIVERLDEMRETCITS